MKANKLIVLCSAALLGGALAAGAQNANAPGPQQAPGTAQAPGTQPQATQPQAVQQQQRRRAMQPQTPVEPVKIVSNIAKGEEIPLYMNPNYSFRERATDLVSRLTLQEKQSLAGNNMAAVPRLGINRYNVWSEALHGVLSGANARVGLAGPSSFPNSVALGSSWDLDLMQRDAAAIADEARGIFSTGTKGLTFWSPVVEPVRDPRWGRTGESFGEDPFLVSEMGGAFVRGFMGDDPVYLKSVPTAKHYFANNSEFNRHVSSSNMDSRDLREFYTAPYKKLIEEDNLPGIMSSYNAVNGVPTTASQLYIDTLARRTWGLDGYVTSDCSGVEDIYTGHYYVETGPQAAAKGLQAGVDTDCGSVYQRNSISAIEQGYMTENDLDRALINMFTIRMRTGEFDPAEMVSYNKITPAIVNSKAHQELAMEVATKTAVLLKNQPAAGSPTQILPLKKGLRKIALIGPQAADVELGPYSGRPESSSMISPYQGITKYIEDNNLGIEVTLANGANQKSKSNLLYIGNFIIQKTDGTTQYYDATRFSSCSEGITVGSGMGTEEQVRSIDDGSWTAYEGVDLTNIDSITVGINIPTEGGIVEVRVDGPDGRLIATINATRAAGQRPGGVYGATRPMKTSALKLGFNSKETLYLTYHAPKDDAIDAQTLETARQADVAIVFVGTDENTATEEADRLTLLLPGNQPDLIKAIAAVNRNVVLVMQTLGCVEVEEFKDLENIKGIIWTGYNGMAQGAAIARVLFGDANPGGKLNATWYKSVKDLPHITDYTLRGGTDADGNPKNGRTLWYFSNPVSYEFGYGLSYTRFEYSNFKIEKRNSSAKSSANGKKGLTFGPMDILTVSADISNVGRYDGDEVVQIYVATPNAKAELERPIKRLKGFKRVTVPAGQTAHVEIDIPAADLWFWDMERECITFDKGLYQFQIGSSSQDIRGTVNATLKGKFVPELKTVVARPEQFILTAGSTTKADFSACMTDDSFYPAAKAKVEWYSNNTSVATVSADGTIQAVAEGVATIFCKVTVNGKSVTHSFAIKVMKPVVAETSYRLTDSGVVLYSAAGGRWLEFDFKNYYRDYYDIETFTDICTGGGQVALCGVKSDGRPALFLSSGGNVWSERQLVYTAPGGSVLELTEVPLSLSYDAQAQAFVMHCTHGAVFTIPGCSQCNALSWDDSALQ